MDLGDPSNGNRHSWCNNGLSAAQGPTGKLSGTNLTYLDSPFSESISYSYFPFLGQRKYNWKEIESIELIEYKALADYGGWGIKWNGDNWSYTTGGTHGILIKTKDKKFLLGTQHPTEVKKVIDHFNTSTHVR